MEKHLARAQLVGLVTNHELAHQVALLRIQLADEPTESVAHRLAESEQPRNIGFGDAGLLGRLLQPFGVPLLDQEDMIDQLPHGLKASAGLHGRVQRRGCLGGAAEEPLPFGALPCAVCQKLFEGEMEAHDCYPNIVVSMCIKPYLVSLFMLTGGMFPMVLT
jgi:hypothetical protein